MNVWLVKLEESLPVDDDYRPYRMGMLANALVSHGHSVTRWCSDVHHLTGKKRYGKNHTLRFTEQEVFQFLSCGLTYASPVSILRFLNNYLLSRTYKKIGRNCDAPDIIVCSMPTPEMAKVSADLADVFHVPLIIDARDYWPEVIESELKGIKSILAKPLTGLMRRNLKSASRRATSLVGITSFYRDHLLNYAKRSLSPLDKVFPLGYESKALSLTAEECKSCEVYWEAKGLLVDGSQKHVYFAGRLNSTVYNVIEPVLAAAKAMECSNPEIRFVLCGSGQYEHEIRRLAMSSKNVVVPGEITAKRLLYLRTHSFVALLPIERRADYQNSLSNKFFEYLSSGLPILSGLDGLPGQQVLDNNCGFVYDDADELIEYITLLSSNDLLRKEMSQKSSALFSEKYDAEVVYEAFATHVGNVYSGYRV